MSSSSFPNSPFIHSFSSSELSYYGYSGYLTTPNTETLRLGELHFHWNTHRALDGEGYETTYVQNNYVLGFSIIPRTEVSVRVVDGSYREANGDPHAIMDLSGHFKVAVLRESNWVPSVAIGLSDIGGGANRYRTQYGVIGKSVWNGRIRVNVGYGLGVGRRFAAKRLNGMFANFAVDPVVGLRLATDYDTEGWNFGGTVFPFVFFPLLSKWTALSPSVHAGHSHFKRWQIGAAVTIPLTRPSRLATGINSRMMKGAGRATTPPELQNDGFTNLRVGTTEKRSEIEYESRRYPLRESDGARAVRVLKEDGVGVTRFVRKVRNVPIYSWEESSIPLKSEESEPSWDIRSLTLFPDYPDSFFQDQGLHTDLILVPRIYRNFASNDHRRNAHLLQWSPRLWPMVLTQLWTGAVFNVAVEIPTVHSAAFRSRGGDPELVRLLVQQLVPIYPWALMQVSVGRARKDTSGLFSELVVPIAQLKVVGTAEGGIFGRGFLDRPLRWYALVGGAVAIDQYRARVWLGKFMDADRGGGVDFTRWFGSWELGVFARGTDRAWTVGSLLRLPLTTRRELFPRNEFRVRLPDLYATRDQTTFRVRETPGENLLLTNVGTTLDTDQNLLDNILFRQNLR